MSVKPTWAPGWEEALDELEAHLLEAEALVRRGETGELEPWTAPELTGPMPAHLAGRARELVQYQQELIADLGSTLTRLRKQRSVTDRIRQATGRRNGSVYVDASA